jgi:hypothetical protein
LARSGSDQPYTGLKRGTRKVIVIHFLYHIILFREFFHTLAAVLEAHSAFILQPEPMPKEIFIDFSWM